VVTILDEPFQIALLERLRQVRVNTPTAPPSISSRQTLDAADRVKLSECRRSWQPITASRGLAESVCHQSGSTCPGREAQAGLHADRQARWQVDEEEIRLAQQVRDSECVEISSPHST
jgi:hypothetical protein